MLTRPSPSGRTANSELFQNHSRPVSQMRELERDFSPSAGAPNRLAIVGRGRLGTAIARALSSDPAYELEGPLGRGAAPAGADVVLLCVPDAEIAAAAAAIAPGSVVGHCSGATGLAPLAPHPAFSLHPLMTFAGDGEVPALTGAAAAVDGDRPATRAIAQELARCLGLHPVTVDPEDRVAYHAAASIASNFLVTLEGVAEALAATAGLERAQLAPLVRATVENWVRLGAEHALTGPIARGDEATVARQRAAVAERAPAQLDVFDAMAAATRDLAAARTAAR